MASFAYIPAKKSLWDGGVDLDTHDMRILLVMSNTDADTLNTAATISAFASLDEMNGAGYARQALASEAVNQDTPNARAEFDAADVVFTGLGNGTRPVTGAVIFRFITNDADSIPVFYIDLSPNFDPGGGTFTVQWNAEGIAQHV